MKHLKSALFAALLGMSAVSMAATFQSDSTRDQRMSDALDSYHGNASRNPSPGPFARAEESVKHGFKKTGHAIKHGAQKTGHAIETGAHKTGEAIHRTGEKIEEKTQTKP
jgi:hypothetical protein